MAKETRAYGQARPDGVQPTGGLKPASGGNGRRSPKAAGTLASAWASSVAKSWKVAAVFLAAFVLVVVSWMLVKPAETMTTSETADASAVQESSVVEGEGTGGELDGVAGESVGDKTVKASDVSGDAITVTFAINDAAYTFDPASGETHLTSTEDLTSSSSGLTFTKWAGRYKITGTGTLATFSIPAGSTLADAGFALPKVTVENIGTENQGSYLSSYNWSTPEGMICNANTVLSADTELSLTLFQDGENYSLNFVCGDESDHSVIAALGGYPSATFALEQSVSDPYIPTAADIDQNYALDGCLHGASAGETFAGWYLKDTSGNEVPFAAGMKLTEEYLDPDADRTIKVYAKWQSEEAPAVEHSVTFMYGDDVIESRQIADGEALGALPDMSVYEDDTLQFLHWADASGNAVSAADEVTGDMVLTAVFKDLTTVEYHSVILHEVDPDGNENGVTIDLSVEDGMTLSDAMKEGAATLSDGTAAADCIWRMGSSSDPVFALSQAVMEDLELYTYSYRITLKLQEETSLFSLFRSVNVSGNTITIELNEGETLKASDLIIDGVDYSLATWTYEEDGQTKTLNIASLISSGATSNIEATALKTDAAATATTDMTVNYYVCINGTWTNVGSTSKAYASYSLGLSDSRYYVTTGQVEGVLGAYGFDAGSYNGGLIFPHSSGNGIAWADANPQQASGIWCIPLGEDGSIAWNVYYSPNNGNGAGSSFATSKSINDDGYKADNTFYSVRVVDPANKIYEKGETLPETQYVLTGGNTVVTVKAADDDSDGWVIGGTAASSVSSGTDVQMIALSGITSPVLIYPSNAASNAVIEYVVTGTFEEAGYSYEAGSQTWNEEPPTVAGESSFVELAEGGYTVLPPDRLTWVSRATYDQKGYMLFTYTFQGWSVTKSDGEIIVIQPGDVLTEDELAQYKDVSGCITLTSIWSVNEQTDGQLGNRIDTVSFFVIISSKIADTEGSTNATPIGDYSDTLFTTNVINGDKANLDGKNLIVGTSDTSAVEVDAVIRELADNGYVASNGEKVMLGEFPTDEQVLSQLRSWYGRCQGNYSQNHRITLDGQEIPLSDLTTENYAVRWFVFKYEDSDGWHVDGLLVPKTGKLTITKTFYGQDEAIEAVQNGFAIKVTPPAPSDPTSVQAPSYELSLKPKDTSVDDHETNPAKTGYTSYDSETNTYTWVIDVWQKTQYTIKEDGYVYSGGNNTGSLAEYLISNSSDPQAGKWQAYDSSQGVTVAATSYAADVPAESYQTVSFLNSYLEQGKMLVRKVDATTGSPIGGVSFYVQDQDGVTRPVWSKPGSNEYYLYDPVNADYVKSEAGIVQGDQYGNFTIIGVKDAQSSGKYQLVEVDAPDGYSRISTDSSIEFSIGADGSITLTSHENASLSEVTAGDGKAYEMRITNKAETTQVIVEKDWLDESSALPVVFTLCLNGTSMGDSYTVLLKSDGSYLRDADGEWVKQENSKAWSHTFDGLPLYVDGQPAAYSIQESWIGEPGSGTAYDPAADSTDGYANYTVVKSAIQYEFNDGSKSDSPARESSDGNGTEYASIANLVVSNKVDNGDVTFSKIDENGNPVPGATFSIYSDPSCTHVVAEATSNERGIVTFTNLTPGTYYMMRETGTPAGYLNDGKTYAVEVRGNSQLIYDSADEEKTPITIIVNEHGVELPESGGPGIGAFALGGLAVIAVAAIGGFALRRRIFGRRHA